MLSVGEREISEVEIEVGRWEEGGAVGAVVYHVEEL